MSRTTPVILTTMCMLRDASGRVLVLDRRDASWGGLTFPGGHVEPGESIVGSVIREMREETGLTVEALRLKGVKDWCNGDGSRYMVLLFTADRHSGKVHSSEEGEVLWMPIDEMRASPRLADSMQNMLRVFLEEDLTEQWFAQDGDGRREMLL